jgi:D-serine deaminase-like pyridoxal phosphate-dependent protein
MEASAIIPGLNVKPENLIGVHRVSPGTVVFHDWRGERQNPGLGLKPAAVIMARVVSNPREGVVTLDCGSKSIAAEAGDPAGYVIGYPELAAMSCSEEHLPCSIVKEEFRMPRGQVCFVVPEHICPTVNLADEVVVYDEVSGGIRFEKVDARGHRLLRLCDIKV